MPLSSWIAGVLVRDRGLGRPLGGIAHDHGPRLGDRLQPGRRVDEIAGDQPLTVAAGHHRSLTGQDSRARSQARRSDLGAHVDDGLHQVEGRTDRALGVVLLRDRRPPHRHHRVADELLDRAPVALDQAPAGFEVLREQLAHLFGIASLGERREPDQVGEENGDQPPLRRRRDRCGVDAGRQRRRRGKASVTSPAPQWLQNRIPGSLLPPHAGQLWWSGAPQPPQNREPGGFSVPQFVHATPMSLGSAHRGKQDSTRPSNGMDLLGRRLHRLARRVATGEREHERRVTPTDHLEHEHDAAAHICFRELPHDA